MNASSKYIAEMISTEGRSKVVFELFTNEKRLLADIIIHYVSYEALFSQKPLQSTCRIENLCLSNKFFELQKLLDFREDYPGEFSINISGDTESTCWVYLEEREENFRFGLSKWNFKIEIHLHDCSKHSFSMIVDQSCVENLRQEIIEMSDTGSNESTP